MIFAKIASFNSKPIGKSSFTIRGQNYWTIAPVGIGWGGIFAEHNINIIIHQGCLNIGNTKIHYLMIIMYPS